MIPVLIVVSSIALLAGLVRWLNKFLPFRLCPVCLGVSGTWIWLSAAVLIGGLNWEVYQLLIAVLLGGTVVGIAYQGEYRSRFASAHPLLWKLLVLVIGFPLAYAAVRRLSWPLLVLEILILAGIGYMYFIRKPEQKSPHHETTLEKKLKQCC